MREKRASLKTPSVSTGINLREEGKTEKGLKFLT
jgi:hypothetical protein